MKAPQKVLIINQMYNNESKDIYKFLIEDKGITALEFPSGIFQMVGSCNGIICLLDNDDYKRFCLWNFAIRRKPTVPMNPHLQKSFNVDRCYMFLL